MVSWGLLVGLVFLPVVLSYCGPIVCTTIAGKSEKKPFNTNISSHSPTKASPVPSSNTSKCDSKDFLHLQQEEETGFYTVPGAKSMPSSAIEGSTQHTTSSRQAGRTICSGEIRSDDEIHAVPSDQAGTATVQPMPDPYDDDDNARAEEGGMFSGCFPHIVG